MEKLQRNTRLAEAGFWLALAAGFAVAIAYAVGACVFGTLC